MTTLIGQMTQEELTQLIESVVERKFMALFNPIEIENKAARVERKKVFKGHFWSVDFQPTNRHVKLHLSEHEFIRCTFDETLAAQVQAAMQHWVRVWGLATIEPTTNEIKELELKGLTILDVEREEPTPKTFDEVAEHIFTKNAELYHRLAKH